MKPGRPGALAPLLALQRTAGNRAVSAALRSDRFRGDPTLEACAADRARLGPPASGDSVRRVQQALIDLGFDLGATGADAAYGPKTAAAVRKFKVDHTLGFTQYGDVGPRTMQTLDDLFSGRGPDQEPEPFGLKDEEAGACPLDDAQSVSPLSRALLADSAARAPGEEPAQTPSFAPAAPTGQGIAPHHLTIPEAIARYKTAVNAATSDQPARNITQSGQFIWTNRIMIELGHDVDALDASGPDGHQAATKARDSIRAIINRRTDRRRLLGELRDMGNATSDAGVKALVAVMLFQPSQSGAQIDAQLWAEVNQTDAIPAMHPFASLPTLDAVFGAESTVCGQAAARMAGRVKRHGGMQPGATLGPAVSADLVAGNCLRNRHRPAPGVDKLLGDVFPQRNVASVAAQMAAALDGGRLIHARVLSGVDNAVECLDPKDSEPPRDAGTPNEEHSLVIIGFDGDTFAFSDPDANQSNKPEVGFGELHVADDHLSTARNAADMFVDRCGGHDTGQHRYQVIRLFTFQ